MVKKLPAMLGTWVQSLGWEDPLEKEMQPTLVSLPGEFHGPRSLAILAWRIPWTEEPGGLQFRGLQRVLRD